MILRGTERNKRCTTAGVELHRDDMTWAHQLAAGQRSALVRYERELVPVITAQLRRRGVRDDVIDEVQQALRARLLVGDGEGPAITHYAGRGPLRAWVMICAFREAARIVQRTWREKAAGDEALMRFADSSCLATGFDTAYRDAFRGAFRTALRKLTLRDRRLLRMSVIDTLSIDEIGKLLGVHRATAARWIRHARLSLARNIRHDLAKKLGADASDPKDVCRYSRVDVSLSGLAE